MAVYKALPASAQADATVAVPSRADSYLGAYVNPMGGGDYWFGSEGSFFHASNATLGTALLGHAAPVIADADTKALLHLYNGGTKDIIPVYLFLEIMAAGTGGTIHYTTIYTDNAKATAKTSGGTVITPVNVRSDGSNTTGAVLTFGAVAVTMSSSKKVFQGLVREVIPVVQDTMLIKFGAPNFEAHAPLTTAGTATCHTVQHVGPVVIGPGGNLNIAQIRASQSVAAQYQFSFGYIER
jgi:hypothetical protein